MAPKKLTEPDKQEILELYRQPEETTSTLAGRYGVSNSTISRLLKATLPPAEYSALIQQKRAAADKGGSDSPAQNAAPPVPTKSKPAKSVSSNSESLDADTSVEAGPPPSPEKAAPPQLRKKRSRTSSGEAASSTASPASTANEEVESKDDSPTVPPPNPEKEASLAVGASDANKVDDGQSKPTRRRRRSTSPETEEASQLSLPDPESAEESPAEPPSESPVEPPAESPTEPPAEPKRSVPQPVLRNSQPAQEDSMVDLEADWDDAPALDDDYDSDDDDDDDYDDDDDDMDGWDETDPEASPHLETLEISPLAEANLPQLCYVVVERSSSELVALPLRVFGDLGQIPETEGDSRTLPIFDNHRVARRFSRRNQRVVKVPNSTEMFQTTSPYLQAKGITRLLLDGQVFALDEQNAEPV
jgi:transposase-like protein